MVYKTEEERIGNLGEKIKQLEAQKKQLEARLREKDRKARTRRLIQVGAIMDSIGISNEDLAKSFKDYFVNNPKSREWLDKFLASHQAGESIQEE